MITVKLNEANFEYDIYSLLKAFYPQEEILVDVNPVARAGIVFFCGGVCKGCVDHHMEYKRNRAYEKLPGAL